MGSLSKNLQERESIDTIRSNNNSPFLDEKETVCKEHKRSWAKDYNWRMALCC